MPRTIAFADSSVNFCAALKWTRRAPDGYHAQARSLLEASIVPLHRMASKPTSKARSATPRRTRAQQREQTRDALIDAAVRVIGEDGYAAASVTAIVGRAGVAQGTFYNYFDSRQDLFDRLLPALANRMLDRIREAQREARTEQQRELASMRAYFDFLHRTPEFYRVLHEAEIFAPAAHRAHVERVARSFVHVLWRARGRGEIAGFSRRELEPVVYMLMGARHYLSMRNAHRNGRNRAVPDWVLKAYMRLIRGLYLK